MHQTLSPQSLGIVLCVGLALTFVPQTAAADKPAIYVWGSVMPQFKRLLAERGVTVEDNPKALESWDTLSKFNVVLLQDWNPRQLLPDLLKRYLESGGGAFVSMQSFFGRQTCEEVSAYYKPYGLEFRLEQVTDTDPSHVIHHGRYWSKPYAYTTAVNRSAITEGVNAVWYPIWMLNPQGQVASCLGMSLSPEWEVVVRGMQSAVSCQLGPEGQPDPKRPGSAGASPPLFAVRECGKGRLAAEAFAGSFGMLGGYAAAVDGVCMVRGDGVRKSDLERLLLNTVLWLAEPSVASGALGGGLPPQPPPLPGKPWPEPEVTYDHWENYTPRPEVPKEKPRHVMALIGVHSNLSDGRNTPEQCITAAKEVGYDVIVFTEALAKMDPLKYQQLAATCKQATVSPSKTERGFAAVPGLDAYVDRPPKPWHYLYYGMESFPEDKYLTPTRAMFNWNIDNYYFENHSPPVVACDIKRGPFPAWFYSFYNQFALVTYREGEPVDEAIEEYKWLAGNGGRLIPVVVHFCYSVDEVRRARRTELQSFGLFEDPTAWSGTLRWGKDHAGAFRTTQPAYVSSGPTLWCYRIVNEYPADLFATDRLRLCLGLMSEHPLREVLVSDSQEVVGRFLMNAKSFYQEIESSFAKHRDYVVDAHDAVFGRLITSVYSAHVWHNWVRMCTDQQNLITQQGLFFKGQWGLCELPAKAPSKEVLWIGNGDTTPSGAWAIIATPCPLDATIPRVEPHSRAAEWKLDAASPFFAFVKGFYRWHSRPGYWLDKEADDLTARLDCASFDPMRENQWVPVPSLERPRCRMNYLRLELRAQRNLRPEDPSNPVSWLQCFMLSGRADHGQASLVTYLDRSGHTQRQERPARETKWVVDGDLAKDGFLAIVPFDLGGCALIPLDGNLSFHLVYEKDQMWGSLGVRLTKLLRRGEKVATSLLVLRSGAGYTADEDLTNLAALRKDFGFDGEPFCRITPSQGATVSTKYSAHLKAQEGGVSATFENCDKGREVVPIQVSGLNDRWSAAAYTFAPGKYRWLRHLCVRHGTGWITMPQDLPRCQMYLGHHLLCSEKSVCLDWLASTTKWCRFVVHNPADYPVTVRVWPAPGFARAHEIPKFSCKVLVPAETSRTVDVGRRPAATPYCRTYELGHHRMFHHETGRPEVPDKDAHSSTVVWGTGPEDKPGFVAYGPGSEEEPEGPCRATVRLRFGKGQPTGEWARISVEACDDKERRVIAQRTIRSGDVLHPGQYQEFNLDFDRPKGKWLMVKVDWTGKAPMTADTLTIRQVSASSRKPVGGVSRRRFSDPT